MSINKLGHNWLQNCCRPICIWLISIGLVMLLHLGPLQNPPTGVCTICTTEPTKECTYWYHTTHGRVCPTGTTQPMEECALLVPDNPWKSARYCYHNPWRMCTTGTTTHGRVYPTGTMQPIEEYALLVPDNTWKSVPYWYHTTHGRVCPTCTTQPMDWCTLLVPEKWNQHRARKTWYVLKSYYSGSPQCSHWQCSPGWRGTPSLWCWARRLCTAPTPLNWAVCLHIQIKKCAPKVHKHLSKQTSG